jgi:hypothetical protein
MAKVSPASASSGGAATALEVKQLAIGHSYGSKLAWLSGPTIGPSGRRKERDLDISSDRLDILEVIARNASISMTKDFRLDY